MRPSCSSPSPERRAVLEISPEPAQPGVERGVGDDRRLHPRGCVPIEHLAPQPELRHRIRRNLHEISALGLGQPEEFEQLPPRRGPRSP